MKDVIINLLAMFGGGCMACCIFCAFLMFKEWLTDQINIAKYNYKKKHRFDGPPIAKCYCKDCASYEHYDNRCLFLGRCVSDNGFCYEAHPRKRDPEKSNK